MDSFKRALKPVLRITYQPVMRLVRGLTLGVRCALIDGDGKVLLVRHTYVPGWTLPGGGVEPGETAASALERELLEETGVALTGPPELHGVFANFSEFPRDHVLVYVARQWRQTGASIPRMEISETGFFAADALPEGVTPGTARRLEEILKRAPVSPEW